MFKNTCATKNADAMSTETFTLGAADQISSGKISPGTKYQPSKRTPRPGKSGNVYADGNYYPKGIPRFPSTPNL